MPGRHLPAPAPDPASRPDPHTRGRRHRRRRARPHQLRAVALLLIPVVLVVAMVVVERTRDGGRRPISQENPFRDMDLPESSSGSAEGQPVQVPTEETQAVAAPDPAEVAKVLPDVPGTVSERTLPAPRRADYPDPPDPPETSEASGGIRELPETPGQQDQTEEPPAAVGRGPVAGRVEVAAQRTEDTQVFRNPDGTMTTEVSAGPVRFKDARGAWVDIDTSLVAGDRGRFRARASEGAPDIAARADDAEVARLQVGDGMSVGFGIAGAADSPAVVRESKATFTDVRPSADLELYSVTEGLKEVVVLRSPDAPTTWRFPLALQGLTPSMDKLGQVVLSDDDGVPQAVIPHGWMEDSGRSGPFNGPVQSTGVTYTLEEGSERGPPVLRVDLDREWLAAADRVYPVRVDPTLTMLNVPADDTYVASGEPGVNFSSAWDIKAGVYILNVMRGYMKFDGQLPLTNANVLDVAVSLYNWASASPCAARPVSLHEVVQSWDGTNMVWPGASIGGEVAQKSFAHSNGTACPGAWETFRDARLTQLVEDWANNVKVNSGLAIRTPENDGQAFKSFYSASCLCNPANPATDFRPKMAVTWTPYGATYAWGANPPVWEQQLTASQQGKIRVLVTNKSQMAWPANGNYKLTYHVYDATNTVPIAHGSYATNLPTTVNRNQSINLLATINPLPAGNYVIRWDMTDWGVTDFSTQGVPPFVTTLPSGANVPPVIVASSPLVNEVVSTLRPTLSLTGFDSDSTAGAPTYSFQICTGTDANSGDCWNSGGSPIGSSSWKVPASALRWNQTYYWRGRVTDGAGGQSAWTPAMALATKVAAPATSRHFGRDPYVPSVAGVTPLIGNYTAATTDVGVTGAGPSLSVTRTYNSRNPYVGLFGDGWTSEWDMNAKPDDAGEGNLVVRYPDGREGRFGRNWDGTYESQDGYFSVVQAPSPRVASFNGPNSSTSLGTTDTGETWQVLSGTWGINGEDAYLATAGSGRSVAVMPAAANGTVRFTVPDAQDGVGVAFRVQDVNNLWSLTVKPSTDQLVLAKRVGSTDTVVATVANACCEASDVFAIGMSGSTLTVYRNDRVVATATDAALSTATKAGLYATATGAGRIGSVVLADDQHRDTFTRANSATSAGTTDNGEKWQPAAGTWGISSNTVYLAGAAGTRNVATVSGAADGTFSFTMPTAQAGLGLAFRYADANNYWRLVAQPASNSWQLVRRDDGVETTVATAAGQCCTAADTLTVTTNGAAITVARNGTQILAVNDPAVHFGSRVGPFAEATGAGRLDDLVLSAAVVLTDKSGTAHAFRSDGRLAKVTDVAGRQLQLNYDSSARLTSVVNLTTNRTLTLGWTGTKVTSVSTASVAAHSGPLTWTYGYTGDTLTSVLAPHTTSPTTYFYAYNGKLGQTNLPRGNTDMVVGYNLDGSVAWREDGLGKRTTYVNLGGSTTTTIRVTDPKGHAEDWEYRNGQLISHRDGNGDRRFSYNPRGFLSQIQDENDNILALTTDSRGNTKSRSAVRMNLFGTLWTNTEYYDYFLGAPGDPRNDLMTVHRDGRSASPTDNTYATVFTYNPYGDLISERSPATADFPSGRTQTWAFSNGTESAIGGGTIPRDLPVSATDPRGKITTYGYDSKGDLRRDQDPAGLVHEYTYDEIGRRLTSREISDTYPAGLTTTFTYTKLSRIATTTEPGVLNALQGAGVTHTPVTTNTYDANGNLTQVVVADSTGGDASRTTTYAYDNADRQTSTTEGAGTPLATTTSVTFDDNGNIATSIDPNGTVTSYTYSTKNLLATTTVEDFVDDPVAGSSPRDVLLEARSYDPAGRLAAVTDTLGRTVRYTYWLDDLLRQEILEDYRPPDLTNGVLSGPGAYDIVLADHTYDGAGNEITTVAGGGLRTVGRTFDAAGRTTQTTLAPGTVNRTATYTYDANTNVTATVFGAAGTPATERVEATYDNASRLTSETVLGDGAAAFTTTYARDQRGFVTGVTDPRGYVPGGPPNAAYTATSTVNAAGSLSRITLPAVSIEENGGAATSQTQASDLGYNTFGEVTHSRDGRGNTTVTTYDRLGQVTTRTGPSYTPPGGSAITPAESWTYDDNGNVLTHTDPRGESTTFVYDKRDRVVAVTDPQVGSATAGVSRTIYDDANNLVTQVDQVGGWTFYAYDDLNRVWATTETERTPAATFTTYTVHNDAGDLVRVLRPANVGSGASWTGEYNQAGDLTVERDETNQPTTYAYDLAGRVTSVTDPLGRSTRATYDRAGRQTGTAQFSPANVQLRSTSTGYDAAGNPTSGTDGLGWTTTASYDALNQLRSVTEPVTASTSITTGFGYAKDGLLSRQTDGRGNQTIYSYNSLGLRESVTEPSTTAHPNVADRRWTTAYDAAGLPVTETAPGGVVRTRTYDELGRLTAETGSGGGATSAARSLTYDSSGRLTAMSHPWGTQNVTYNDRGLVTGASGDGGTSTFTYDANGRMASRGDNGSYSSFAYSARDTLTTVTGTATGGSRTLSYNAAAEPTTVTYAGATRTFGYDDLGRTTTDTLTGPGGTLRSQTYTYDANDNRLTTTIGPATVAGAGTQTYTYDRSDRLTSWTNPASAITTYGWDANGNRISVNGTAATYDERNRLLSDGTATYTYTPRGTLATRVAGATTATTGFNAFDQLVSDNTTAATTYEYDGLGRLAVRNSTTRLTYDGLDREPAIDGTSAYSRDPDGDITAAGTPAGNWATLTDTHGDLVAAFTTNGASLTDDRYYGPFGEPLDTGSATLRVGYQGSWTDPTTTKVSAQARWYTPGTGGFTSRDTADLPFTGSVFANRYTYGAANPLAYNDTTGYAASNPCDGRFYDYCTDLIAKQQYLRLQNDLQAKAYRAYQQRKAAADAQAAQAARRPAPAPSQPAYRPAPAPARISRATPAPAPMRPAPTPAPAPAPATPLFPSPEEWRAMSPIPTTPPVYAPFDPSTTSGAGVTPIAGPAVGPAPASPVAYVPRQATRPLCPDLNTCSGQPLPQQLLDAASGAGCPAGAADAVLADACAPTRPDHGLGLPGVNPPDCESGGLDGNPLSLLALCQRTSQTSPGRTGICARTGVYFYGGCWGSSATSPGRTINPGTDGDGAPRTSPRSRGLIGRLHDFVLERLARSCQDEPNSFDGDTDVLMADGSHKKIRDIRVGDQVLATDPTTGRTEPHTVTRLIVGTGDKHLVDITVTTPDGPVTITATDHHPFWDTVDQQWTYAEDLTTSAILRTPDGQPIPVTSTREYQRTDTVYNLTVDTLHAYYVLAGRSPVLVHNSNCGTTDLHRVSPLGRGSSELDDGLDPEDFPLSEELDGAAHFGNSARVEDFAAYHGGTHGQGYRVTVPEKWLRDNDIEVWEGINPDQLEYVIPRHLFDEFNKFPRSPWTPGTP